MLKTPSLFLRCWPESLAGSLEPPAGASRGRETPGRGLQFELCFPVWIPRHFFTFRCFLVYETFFYQFTGLLEYISPTALPVLAVATLPGFL